MSETAMRKADLRHILSERRREMQIDVQGHIELALLQMRTEALIRIDEALVRLDAGEYGSCFECAGQISERRLRALPFAVRCRACEETHEREQGHVRKLAQRRGTLSLFPEVVGS